MTILNVSQGLILPVNEGTVKYYDRNTAKIDVSRDPGGTEIYLRPPVWAACTAQNVMRSTQVTVRPIDETRIIRVGNIFISCQPPDGTTFIFVTFEFYDMSNRSWVELQSGAADLSLEFSVTQFDG